MPISTLIPSTVSSFDYYLRKLPLYLRNDESFVEHFKIWYDLLVSDVENAGVLNVANMLLYLSDIFDADYLQFVNSMSGSDDGNASDVLDKLAALYGLNRVMIVSYEENDSLVSEQISLTNEELLLLTKASILKHHFDGTYGQLRQFYSTIGLHVFVITTDLNATALISLANIAGEIEYSDNVQKLFKSGLLVVNSMGIKYVKSSSDLVDFMLWDNDEQYYAWGTGLWAI